MIISVICVGRLKEKYFEAACEEYLKRLSRFGKVTVTEVAAEREPQDITAASVEKAMNLEGERMLRQIKEGDTVVALTPFGQRHTSESFAQLVENTAEKGRVCFLIGGSLGLGKNALHLADLRISLSDMTFPHELARVVLLEQLYRAAKINAGERYHK
jgi:23S rRNA (pseudouridine1915-N3)-methyltransferase